mgnify:FL=1
MLYLNNIVKKYETAGSTVEALKGISVGFRNSEFVAILGPSGCGKTTLLNIIGGLDRYTSGDLVINGRSTKEYRDADWDSYRNHSIGFVFQSYNLIPHQSVLANVELALTLSGVGREERRRRAADALKAVGLGDQLHKKPGQMSGGQMQRVAIARALVNDPDILLADEPTGALDTETSVQIMDILREVAGNRLVIMVTHNPELAEKYATRIVRLLDGHIVSDTAPVSEEELAADTRAEKKDPKKKGGKKGTSMSFATALSLSFNNLLTKKARTFLTSFAGSIGIIGIALILAMSNGFQAYINRVEADTLSTYPISLEAKSVDMSGILSSMTGKDPEGSDTGNADSDRIHSVDTAGSLYAALQSQVKSNDIKAFYKYMNEHMDTIKPLTSAIQYQYNVALNLYNIRSPYGNVRVNPSSVADAIEGSYSGLSMFMNSSSWDVFDEMMDNEELLRKQYDVVAGKWPTAYDEVVLVVGKNNNINVVALYTLGLLDQSDLVKQLEAISEGKPYESPDVSYAFDEIIYDDKGTSDTSDDTGWSFRLVLESDYYKKNSDGRWEDRRSDALYVGETAAKGAEIKVVGIIRPSADAVAGSITGSIAYTPALTKYVIDETARSEIVNDQKNNPDCDVISGKTFASAYKGSDEDMIKAFREYVKTLSVAEKAEIMRSVGSSSLTEDEKDAIIISRLENMSEAELEELSQNAMKKTASDPEFFNRHKDTLSKLKDTTLTDDEKTKLMLPIIKELFGDELLADSTLSDEDEAARLDVYVNEESNRDKLPALYKKYCLSTQTLESALEALSAVDYESPVAINIYPTDFSSKEKLSAFISEYNDTLENEEEKITYTDYIALFISSVSTIIDTISYVLIGFVSVSLVVSSIMIGVITYISVLERTKEIGILRSIGASKHDIRMVFNAETFIIGLVSGLIGIGVTLLLTIPVNLIIGSLAGIYNMALLPVGGALILILISVVLTVIAGLLPASMAAKRDPVVALRSE